MFLLKKPNKSGSVSIQVISKEYGRYRDVERVGVRRIEQKGIHIASKSTRCPETTRKENGIVCPMKRDLLMNPFYPI
jgi:hypothetical protein